MDKTVSVGNELVLLVIAPAKQDELSGGKMRQSGGPEE
jgi:hypothetical protein